MKKRFSIRSYLSLSHAFILIISLGAIGLIWSRNEYKVISDELQKSVEARAVLLSTIIRHELEEHDQIRIDFGEFPEAQLADDMLAVYVDHSENVIELTPGSVSPQQINEFLQFYNEYPGDEQTYVTLVNRAYEPTSIYAASPVKDTGNNPIGRVCILMPIGKLDVYIQRLRWMLMGAIFIVTMLGVGASTLMTQYFSRHFSRAQQLAGVVAEGNYDQRIPEAGPSELRDLAHYLNVMAEKLQTQLSTRKTLLANVAHELARPLAGLQIGIESLRKGAIQDPELADDVLVSMGQTVQRLGGLIEDITLAAQPLNHPIELNRTELAVEPFLKGVASRFWGAAELHNTRIEVRVDEDVPNIYVDEKRLNQIISNLVDNAIKFTRRGKAVRLLAERMDESHIRIMVHDGGKGIHPDEANRYFEPFFQGAQGRQLKQGMGLGLAIAQQLAQTHGGSLTLENHPAGGAIAILTLPVSGT